MSTLRLSFSLLPLFPLASLALVAAACGGAVDTSGSQRGSDPNGPGSSSGSPGSSVGSRPGSGNGSGKTQPCEGSLECYAGDKQLLGSSACPQDDARCYSVSTCGHTIWCVSAAQCDGYPECDPGDTQIKSSADCLQDDARCYQRSTCGVTIWCTGPTAQDAGVIPPVPPPQP